MTTLGYPMLGRVGRLGNQLWEVASTIGMARYHGMTPVFPTGWPYRRWFSLPDEMFSDAPPDALAVDVARSLPGGTSDPTYLQDFRLWSAYSEEITEVLAPSPAALVHLRENCREFLALPAPIISVHVRRGDNAHDPAVPDKWRYHPLRPLWYYQRGLQVARQSFGYVSVAVFSDDPDWCVENLPGCDYYHRGVVRPKENEPGYDDPPLDWVDLFLMAWCSAHVISNSTFSWWGAYLSGDPQPIYSWPWFGEALVNEPAHLMFPSGWRRLTIPAEKFGTEP